jgi:branched-chain amino acid transport system permease protein
MIGIILETSNVLFFGGTRHKFPPLIQSVTYDMGGVFITNKKIMIVLVSIGLMLALHQFVTRTRYGMAMRAMAYDYTVVPLMGVPMNRIGAMTFAIGSALAAAAGILFGLAYPVLDPYMGVSLGWKAFVAAILGGRGSILGACIAGFMLGFIEIMTVPAIHILNQVFAMNLGSNLRDLIAYSIVLAILVVKPHGLFGEAYSARLRL